MKPTFSIIIPVYNVAPYLRECLDSVLAQTYPAWEAICVDDGSTDGSGAILDEYAAKDARLKIIHQPNAGVSAARNRALKKVKGEWITFVDADDVIDPWRLEFLNELILSHPQIDWIHENLYSQISLKGKGGLARTDTAIRDEVGGKDVYLFGWRILKRNALLWLNTYRATSLKTIRFPEGVRYAEDDIFELRALPRLMGCLEVGYGGYWYRIDREGAASRVINVKDSVKIHALLWETAEEQKPIISALKDRNAFRRIFTQTVRKDFTRVFRLWWRTTPDVRQQHIRLARQIAKSPYFAYRYIDGRCRLGYALYMRTGFVGLMTVQNAFWSLGSWCKRGLKSVLSGMDLLKDRRK